MSNPRTPAGGAGVGESVGRDARQVHDTATAGQSDIDGRVLTAAEWLIRARTPTADQVRVVMGVAVSAGDTLVLGGGASGPPGTVPCRFFPGEYCHTCAIGPDLDRYAGAMFAAGWLR